MRHKLCALLWVALCAAGLSSNAAAQTAADKYPDKPIRIIVPFAPGGSTDIIARVIGQKMTERWGQSVVVESRPGAATMIGTRADYRAVKPARWRRLPACGVSTLKRRWR